MCIVDTTTHPTCTHTTTTPLFPCSDAPSPLLHLTPCPANPTIRAAITSLTHPYCPSCYRSSLTSIQSTYIAIYAGLVSEAKMLGWSKEDVEGSAMELGFEMEELIAQWTEECGYDAEAVGLRWGVGCDLGVLGGMMNFSFDKKHEEVKEQLEPVSEKDGSGGEFCFGGVEAAGGKPFVFRAATPEIMKVDTSRATKGRMACKRTSAKKGRGAMRLVSAV